MNETTGPEKTSFGSVDGSFFLQIDTLPTMLSATPTDTSNIDRQRLTTTLAK